MHVIFLFIYLKCNYYVEPADIRNNYIFVRSTPAHLHQNGRKTKASKFSNDQVKVQTSTHQYKRLKTPYGCEYLRIFTLMSWSGLSPTKSPALSNNEK